VGFDERIELGLLTGFCFAFTSMAINMLYEKKLPGIIFYKWWLPTFG
jgi:hypothetical protein